ncbi:hypothetical protein [Dermacoccus barathri]|uniref:hypothetical protein n=1 Tax=Dermacoccus barathri TaxID=322601 RepID=UPI001879E54A|nr:hypothetical protein [Dermacoccus barathri]MBE7372725.1 hypothetical protein [Dermacoccus barathri]
MTKRTLIATTALAATALMLSACGPDSATGAGSSTTTSTSSSAQGSTQKSDAGQRSGTQATASTSTSASGSSTNDTSSSTLNLGVVQAASDGHQVPGIGDVPQPREFDLSTNSGAPHSFRSVTWSGWNSPVAYSEGKTSSGTSSVMRAVKGECEGKPAYSTLTVADATADGELSPNASTYDLCKLSNGPTPAKLALPSGNTMTLGTAGQEAAGYGVGDVKPAKLAITQQGGALKDLVWQDWGTTAATAKGKVWVITGSESEGKWSDATVTLTAKKVGGRYVYATAIVHTPSQDENNGVRYDLLDVSKTPTTQPMGN